MKVLVTGGAGYIGSVTAKALEEAGHTPVILDSLLTGPQVFVKDRIFYEGDIADRALLRRIVDEHPDLDATIHMAARIVVPESVELPYEYYRDNVAKSLELFDELDELGKTRVLFSSSASLYALKPEFEVVESDPLDPGSPYARTKRMMEMVLEDIAAATDAAGDHPALLQPDRLRPRPRVRDLRQGALPRPRPAGDGGPRAEGRVHDHRHRPPDARRHRASATTSTSGTSRRRTSARSRGSTTCWPTVGAPSTVINIGTGSGVTVRELVASFERVFGHDGPGHRGAAAPG